MPATSNQPGAKPSDPALPLQVVTRATSPGGEKRSTVLGWVSRALLVAAIFGGGVALGRGRSAAPAASPLAETAEPRRVAGLGRILPEQGVIVIAAPHGAGDARVRAIRVGEGESAKEGDVLVVLDNESVLLAAVESARAQLALREASAAQVLSSVRITQREVAAQLARATVAESSVQREQRRAERLFEAGALAQASLDLANTQVLETQQEVARLNASLARVASGPIATQADVVVATRQVALAEADLTRALSELERAYVRAPSAGTVLTVHTEPGERPGSAGLMNFGSLQRMKVEVEVYQSQISRIEKGMRADITASSLDRSLHGVVTKVGLEIGKQVVVDASPAANTDARVVLVTVALDEASSSAARHLTNLLVTARFEHQDLP